MISMWELLAGAGISLISVIIGAAIGSMKKDDK